MRSMPSLPGAVRARGIAARELTVWRLPLPRICRGFIENASRVQEAFCTIGAGCAAVSVGSLHDNSSRPAQIMPTNTIT